LDFWFGFLWFLWIYFRYWARRSGNFLLSLCGWPFLSATTTKEHFWPWENPW